MPVWLKVVLQVAFFAFIFLIVYNQLKIRILYKLNPNKWLILGLAAASFFLPILIANQIKYNLNSSVWQYVQSTLFIIFFLWFVDIRTGAIAKVVEIKQKENAIRPKPKAARAAAPHSKKKNKKKR